jgi:MFS transporter, DHA1 family, tetracycline resistance protein
VKDSRQPAIAFIFITLLVDVIGIAIIIPVIPGLIQELGSVSVSEASRIGGWLTTAYAVMQFLFSPILGNLSDRYGRRPVLLISLLGLGLDYIFLVFAPSLFWLFIGRIISGVMGASFTTASAYIADITPPEKRAQNFGLIGVAFGLGFIIGPVLGGLLGTLGPRVPFIAAAAFSLLNLIYGYFILPESLPADKRRKFEWKRANPIGSFKSLRKSALLSGLVVVLFFVYMASHAVQSTWPYFTEEVLSWTEKDVGISLGVVGILVALVQGVLIRKINPILGPKRSVLVGMSLYALGLIAFSFATRGWMMYAFLLPYCLGGIAGPALQGIISSQVPMNEQGELQGGLTGVMSLTNIIGPVMMSTLFAEFTAADTSYYFPGAAFMAGAVLTIVSGVLAWHYLNTHKVS